ncbi:zeta toxin family protein [uncultured Algimonas sp.]|uniref:zeta toxin family protein n=1 Tax=uncultured Algimonas sp. TaxID=1547920 RepID=UPI0026178F64|nr:zeta toxin family protein [uncultured Algimonas sp.]
MAQDDSLEKRPTLYLIAGPNGAGKSTLYKTRIAPRTNAPFLNADVLQRAELKDQTVQGAYKAAQIVRERQYEHLRDGKSFVTETVFSHKSKNQLVIDAKERGFRVVLYHVEIRSEDLSVARVKQRVKDGGHDVPEDKARARYHRNKPLIREAVREADDAFVYDNSTYGRAPRMIARFHDGQAIRVSKTIPKWARNLYKEDLWAFTPARLNDAAASYENLSQIAREQVSPKAKVLIPRGRRSFTGPIIAESAMHVLQQTDDGRLYAHFKSLMDKVPPLERDVKIDYPHSRKAVVKRAGAISTQMSLAEAKDVLTASIGVARKAFEAEGKAALSVQDTLSKARADALLKSLKLAPKMIDALKVHGLTSIDVQTRPDASKADIVRSIVRATTQVYNAKGVGKTKARNYSSCHSS